MSCPSHKRLLNQIRHDCWTQGVIQGAQCSTWPPLWSFWAWFALQMFHLPTCSRCSCSSPAYLKEIPLFGELHHASTSLSELLCVPAGFSFPQPTVTLLHVLHTRCARCCGWALAQVLPAWVQSRWEREGSALPLPELMLSLLAHRVRVTARQLSSELWAPPDSGKEGACKV